MNKFSNRLTDCRSRLIDAEANLNFMRNRENLQTLLNHDSPDVVVGAMIDQAWNLVAEASGDCEFMQNTHNDDFLAELKQSAAETRDYMAQRSEGAAPVVEDVAVSRSTNYHHHVDTICEIHDQTRSMLSMFMLYLSQARDGGDTFNESVLESYVWQLLSNIERGQAASKALCESLGKGAAT